VAAIDDLSAGLQFIPALNVPASMIRIFIAGGRGNAGEAAINAAMVLPFAKDLQGITKGGKLAEEVLEGGAKYSEDLVKAAQELYPKKAGIIELHHIEPIYLGGAKDGARVPLDAAYHQLITNAFRNARKYGLGPLKDPARRREIMETVYKELPLPPGFDF